MSAFFVRSFPHGGIFRDLFRRAPETRQAFVAVIELLRMTDAELRAIGLTRRDVAEIHARHSFGV